MDRLPVALSEKEWRQFEFDAALGLVWARLSLDPLHLTGDLDAIGEQSPPFLRIAWGSVAEEITVSRRHGLAALALHGKPYGFDQADLDALNDLLRATDDWIDLYSNGPGLTDQHRRAWERVLGVRDKIAALLPPRAGK